jgi:glyoxylase-like metal-dependent hydrolase (beta-lactamase superfamily II)
MQRAFGLAARVPATLADAVRDWDGMRLSHDTTGQRCERFALGGTLAAGERLVAGGRRWEALAAPGHDPDSLLLFDVDHGVLLSADALWEQGFGLVFPEIVGEPGFDDVEATLDLIAELPAKLVVPGHGGAFTDIEAAIGRARERLAGYRADPARHARHAVKVLLKYHMMEERAQARAELLQWAVQAPLLRAVFDTAGRRLGQSAEALCERMLGELIAGGALRLIGDRVEDA